MTSARASGRSRETEAGLTSLADASVTITGVVRGRPASGGTCVGVARVLHDADDDRRIQPGDVLVCPAFRAMSSISDIGALVVDAGGTLSNPAIVARELGVPAVVATGNGTTLIGDGQRVAVDGARGLVLILA